MAIKKKFKKISPYVEFKNWLFNPLPESRLSESTIKEINPRAVLSSLGNLGGVTIYLNKWFNDYNLMMVPSQDFYFFVKELVQKHKVKKTDFTFYASEKTDKSLKEIHTYFPHLKRYEVFEILQVIENNDEYETLAEKFGLKKKPKKKKLTKELKKELKQENKIELKDNDSYESWNEWEKCFKN